jgi:hypothetical protein
MSQPYMIAVRPYLQTCGLVRTLQISLPLIEPLVDGVRYHLPDDIAPPSGHDRRPVMRPRITQMKAPPRAPRAPSLRSLVRYALKCQSAEELGERLRKRYQRQKQCAGIKTGPTANDERELDRLLERS